MSTLRTILITATRQQALRALIINRGPAGAPGADGSIGPVGPTGPGAEPYISDTPPDPSEHPQWQNSANGCLYGYHGTAPDGVWVNLSHTEGPLVPSLHTFAAVGDSNSDRATNVSNIAGQNAICYDQRAWGSLIEQLANYRIVGVGPTEANTYKVGALYDRDHGYSGITAYAYIHGSEVYGDFLPIDDAIAADPDFYLVNIGTNDVPDNESATVIARVRAVWAALVATGKPVIGTDILQRASSHSSVSIRDKIIAINNGLRAVCEEDGLWNYRQWDDLVVKDEITGYAADEEYPDNLKPAPYQDGVHWGADVSRRLANDIIGFVSDYWTGTPPTIPADGHPSWVTPNPYFAGSVSGLATSWTNQFLGTAGVDVIFSKITDADGVWQRVEIVNQRAFGGGFQSDGIYSRLTGAGVTALIGTLCRPTARIRIPAGQSLSGVGISVQCVGATGTEDWTYHASAPWPYSLCPIAEYDATIYCDPFTVPPGTTQIWILINPGSGTGIFDVMEAGVISE